MVDYEFGGINYQHSFDTLDNAHQWVTTNYQDDFDMLVILEAVNGQWLQTEACFNKLMGF